MKTIEPFNLRLTLAALLWGLVLHLGRDLFLGYLSGRLSPPQYEIAFMALAALTLLLFPLIVFFAMKWRTGLWMTPLVFSLLGTALSAVISMAIVYLRLQDWVTAGILIVGTVVFAVILSPQLKPVLAKAREFEGSPEQWDQLNELSLLRVLFLQIPSIRYFEDRRG